MESAFLKSLEPNINNVPSPRESQRAKDLNEGLKSLNLIDDIEETGDKSVLLLDDNERLLINSEQGFLKALNINPTDKLKVVSIFGNTGEGKSYTMNHLFFNGEEVFRTSSSQTSCTLGVWAKYNPQMKVICLDTEGLLGCPANPIEVENAALGISKKENQRTRMLLKVLAVSDVIIFRTRAERLQRDMYSFLGGASKAYKDHFAASLQKAMGENASGGGAGFGPGVVVFHETRHTQTLHESAGVTQSAEDILQATFAQLNISYDAFSFIKYVGINSGSGPTSFKELEIAVMDKLDSTEVRSRRDAKYIYLTLKNLNDKFQNQLTNETPQLYLPAFFTCQEKCQSCHVGCKLSMGHKEEGEPHCSDQNCLFQHQYQNCVYLCKACYKNGHRTVVKPSYQSAQDSSWSGYFSFVWSGYLIECSRCGIIYQSRKHWYGNKNPEDCAVRIQVVHVWPGDKIYFQEKCLFGSYNSAQKVLDGVTMVSEVLASVSSQPKKVISDWAADKIAPSYWRPNHEIKECHKCNTPFEPSAKKHHCRSCGEGFCETCSSKNQPVPERGWFSDVRVCDDCYKEEPPSMSNAADGGENVVRQLGETVVNSFSAVKTVLHYPKEFIKEQARPAYWTPDAECIRCCACEEEFSLTKPLHHCRDCGRGVCAECSQSRKPVPLRGWHTPVRVCDKCCR
ncbi:unnamed protein product [Acanthoscelides obtectus]|uniref:FYVE-type domain-containing protein n=1 Tax=Acanthoscelides obtectus TaxID=200917 RepID=A0A9P0JXI5_ACAOB|nr:unnamed protein product [Acanthoscelides obtectus]CAK1623872.1 Zinc finger FYVE domain-containing protein 1 [Acanthoscelides obtectus]